MYNILRDVCIRIHVLLTQGRSFPCVSYSGLELPKQEVHFGTENTVISSQVLFHDGSLLHSQFNTQLLITVHNSSRIIPHV
jgi:hypothetical protein